MTTANRGVSRRDFLKLSGAGLAGAALLGVAGCGGGGGADYGAAGGGSGEFHSAYPYQLPPAGHFNTYDTINAITLDFYWDLTEMPMAIYSWPDDEYRPLMANEWGFEPPDV